MSLIQFHLPITPPKSTSQGKRMAVVNGRPMFFKKLAHQGAENDLLTLAAQHRPDQPLTGPISLTINFAFPWRKSEPKKIKALRAVPHTTKPDCDNAAKLICDVLGKLGFYQDDAQISHLVVTKQWSDDVGIMITLETLYQHFAK